MYYLLLLPGVKNYAFFRMYISDHMEHRRRFTTTVANWHRQMLVCNADSRQRAVLARSTDHASVLHCQVRFSKVEAAVGYQVAAHLPPKVLELMSDAQKAVLADPVWGMASNGEREAKDLAALQCVEVLVDAQVLDVAYKAVPPPLIQVRQLSPGTRKASNFQNRIRNICGSQACGIGSYEINILGRPRSIVVSDAEVAKALLCCMMRGLHALQDLEKSWEQATDATSDSVASQSPSPRAVHSRAPRLWHECRGFEACNVAPALLTCHGSAASAGNVMPESAAHSNNGQCGGIMRGCGKPAAVPDGTAVSGSGEVRGVNGGVKMSGPGFAKTKTPQVDVNGVKPAAPGNATKSTAEAAENDLEVRNRAGMSGPGYPGKKSKLHHAQGCAMGVSAPQQPGPCPRSECDNARNPGTHVGSEEVWMNVFVDDSGGDGKVRSRLRNVRANCCVCLVYLLGVQVPLTPT